MNFNDSLAITSNQFVYYLRKIDDGPESYSSNYTESTKLFYILGSINKSNVVMLISFINYYRHLCSILFNYSLS